QPEKHIGAGILVFLAVPGHDRAKLSTAVPVRLAGSETPLVDAEALALRVVAHVARMNDDEIVAMIGVRSMAGGRDLAAGAGVVEWKSAEVLCDQNGGVALALVGAKCARRHDVAAAEAERETKIVKPRRELAVADGHAADFHVAHDRRIPGGPPRRPRHGCIERAIDTVGKYRGLL